MAMAPKHALCPNACAAWAACKASAQPLAGRAELAEAAAALAAASLAAVAYNASTLLAAARGGVGHSNGGPWSSWNASGKLVCTGATSGRAEEDKMSHMPSQSLFKGLVCTSAAPDGAEEPPSETPPSETPPPSSFDRADCTDAASDRAVEDPLSKMSSPSSSVDSLPARPKSQPARSKGLISALASNMALAREVPRSSLIDACCSYPLSSGSPNFAHGSGVGANRDVTSMDPDASASALRTRTSRRESGHNCG
mmetsp:Transcript_104862/g.321221  ORF Transcript_104862/g.321221 Transcript_104862/m.321221 type:complete len:254 (-) Transcript_104862:390-1151(-)